MYIDVLLLFFAKIVILCFAYTLVELLVVELIGEYAFALYVESFYKMTADAVTLLVV